MTRRSSPTHSSEVRRMLGLLSKARSQYAGYLHQVANGERTADAVRRECLKKRCEIALEAWRQSHDEWRNETWPQA